MNAIKTFGKKYPLILGIIGFAVLFISIQLLDGGGYVRGAILRVLASAAIVIILFPALGGEGLKFPGKGWKNDIKLSRGLLISSGLLGVFMMIGSTVGNLAEKMSGETASALAEDNTLSDNWLGTLLLIAVYCITIGLVEEIAFRRALFQTAVLQFPNMRNGKLILAIITSAIFGFVHVAMSLSPDPIAIISSVLKTLETGMMGFIMCGALYQSRNIWTIAMIHAFNDFALLSCTIWHSDQGMSMKYVTTSADGLMGIAQLGVYVLFCLIYLPGVIRTVRIFRENKEEVVENAGEGDAPDDADSGDTNPL